MPTDLFAGEQLQWATDLLIGTGFASFLAATIRELFDMFGGGRRA